MSAGNNSRPRLTEQQVVAELESMKGSLTLQEFSASIGVSFQYLAKVLNGERTPGDKILEYMGIVKRSETWYERV